MNFAHVCKLLITEAKMKNSRKIVHQLNLDHSKALFGSRSFAVADVLHQNMHGTWRNRPFEQLTYIQNIVEEYTNIYREELTV